MLFRSQEKWVHMVAQLSGFKLVLRILGMPMVLFLLILIIHGLYVVEVIILVMIVEFFILIVRKDTRMSLMVFE